MDRIILHSDLNNFFASVETLYNPKLRGTPMAVLGDPEARHGIVLAKNNEAKAYGIATGDAMWQAREKCPSVVFVPPHYDRYVTYSKAVRQIYSQYTDLVEPYGLDECWLDVTSSTNLFGSGIEIADKIRDNVRKSTGLSVSVGVSYNKIFAKLGSDMKKPDATTLIDKNHFKQRIWGLPASDLLYVGRSTSSKLKKHGIVTIGDIAKTNPEILRSLLGKHGTTLWNFANGYDNSPVLNFDSRSVIKSVSNSTTPPRDLVTEEDVKITLTLLAESVSSRLRDYGYICKTVTVSIRDCELCRYERQAQLEIPNRTAQSLMKTAFALYKNNKPDKPIRSIGIRASGLIPFGYVQESMFEEVNKIQKREDLEQAVDKIRAKYGYFSVRNGTVLSDRDLSALDAKEEHVILPFGFQAQN